jgi:hypothetical protein
MPDFNFSNQEFSYRIHYPQEDDKKLVDFYCEIQFAETNPDTIDREILPFTGCEITSGHYQLTKF